MCIYEKIVKIMMVTNPTNINKRINYLSPQTITSHLKQLPLTSNNYLSPLIIEYEKDHDIRHWEIQVLAWDRHKYVAYFLV